ncbi:MAG: acyl--CoA ligase [Bacteroidales bacterium]|nr:acyl--CoA ligase [Bacteroidales bacterium]
MTTSTHSLYQILKETATKQPDRVAITYFGINISYKDLMNRIDKTADAFKKHGVVKGDCIAVALPTMPESVMCFYALHKIGAIPCMIDVRYTPKQMCEIIDRTNSKMLFIMGFSCKDWGEADVQLHVEKVVVCSGADSIPGFPFWYGIGEWFNGRKKVFLKNKKFCHWKDFIKKAQGNDVTETYHWAPDEMTALFQTSGTTGTVKSVMLTTENILHAVFPEPPVLNNIQSEDTTICFLPIFAFYGANAVILALSHGMRAVVIPIANKDAYLKLIVKHKPQHIFSVPAYWDVISQEKDNQDDFSFLKTANIAGDVLNSTFEKSINDFLRERGCRYDITKAYGMTETAGVISFTPQGSPHQYEAGFSGKAVGGYEVKTFDDEICVRSEMRILGYYKNEEATRDLIQTHSDGSQWLHTGDMGYVDEEGNIFVIGRKKRMIVRHDGSKVFPVEIEDCLTQHPLVASCAVVPIQDPDHSESKLPKAFVVLKDASKKTDCIEELIAYCKTHLPVHLVPAAIECIDVLPMNGNGKVDYQKLLSTGLA